MSLIEGVGDEVTIFFMIIAVLSIVSLAWMSTHIHEIPFFSLIIVELSQRRRNLANRQASPPPENVANETNIEHNTEEEDLLNLSETQTNETDETCVEATVSQNEEIKCSDKGSKEGQGSRRSSVSSDSSQTRLLTVDDSAEGESPDLSGLSQRQGNLETSDSKSESSNIQGADDDSNLSEDELRRRRLAFFSQDSGQTELRRRNVQGCENSSNTESLNTRATEPETVEDRIELENVSNLACENRNSEDNTRTENQRPEQHNNADNSQSDNGETKNPTAGSGSNQTSAEGANPEEMGQIHIRLKYLNDTQRSVRASPNDTIGQFRRANFATELAEDKLVRFIFNGRDLRNDAETLQANNIINNSVLHCLITTINRENTTPRANDGMGFDIGNIMLPMFGLLLVVIWYLRFEYRQFFTATATISLIGVTSLYIAAMLAAWEGYRRGYRAPLHDHIE